MVIMDMEAGLEHLGGNHQSMDEFICGDQPGARSVQTYKNVKRLAKDLGITRGLVADKVRNERMKNLSATRFRQKIFLE